MITKYCKTCTKKFTLNSNSQKYCKECCKDNWKEKKKNYTGERSIDFIRKYTFAKYGSCR